MADTFTYKNASGTSETGAADDIGGVKFARIKLVHGIDGVNDGDVATTNPLPVVQTGTPSLPTGAATESTLSTLNGKVTAVNTGAVVVSSSALPSGASTSANQSTANSSLSTIATNTSKTDSAPATVNITVVDATVATTTGANSQSIYTGTPDANSSASFAITSQETIDVQVSGTWTGTLQSEVSFDGGTRWYTRGIHQFGSTYTATTFTANFGGLLNVAGMTNFRLRATAAVTGTATVRIVASLNTQSVYLANSAKISDATTPSQQLAIDSSGRITVINSGTFAVQNSAATPAGTNLIGQVSASNETATVYNGTTALTPKFVAIAASSSGNNTVLAAVVSKKIRVLAVQINANAAVNFKWQSGAGGNDLTGLNYSAANGGYVLPYNPVGWFETASNTILNLNLSGAIAVGGSLTYVEV